MNPYHDEKGRFTTGPSTARIKVRDRNMQRTIDRALSGAMKPSTAEFMMNTLDKRAPLRLKVALAQAMKRR